MSGEVEGGERTVKKKGRERRRKERSEKEREGKMKWIYLFNNMQNDCLLCLKDLAETLNYQNLVLTSADERVVGGHSN